MISTAQPAAGLTITLAADTSMDYKAPVVISDKETKPKKEKPNLHLIWLGSPVQTGGRDHVARIKQWEALNKDYQVTVWVDAKHEVDANKKFEATTIIVKSVETLKLSAGLKALVERFVETRADKLIPNYAAASDVLRFKILNDFNGWYVDTDIEPIDISEIKINPMFNFYFYGDREDNLVTALSPCVLFAGANNFLTTKAMLLLEYLSKFMTDEHIKLIRNGTASLRALSTMNSTGAILRYALANISYKGEPVLEITGSKDRFIANLSNYDSVCSVFENNLEQSWILKSYDFMHSTPLDGIILDPGHDAMMSGGDLSKEHGLIDSIYIMRRMLPSCVSQVNISSPPASPTFFAASKKSPDSLSSEKVLEASSQPKPVTAAATLTASA
jgi:hypothetical protein